LRRINLRRVRCVAFWPYGTNSDEQRSSILAKKSKINSFEGRLKVRPLPAKVFAEEIFKPVPSQGLLNGLIIFLAICAILFFGREILIPIIFAIFLSILLGPCVRGLQKLRIPKTFSILVVVFLTFSFLFGITAIVATTLTNLAGQLPQYEKNLRDKAHSLQYATSGGTTVEKAANVLKDLSTELQQPDPNKSPETAVQKPIPVELRSTNLGPLDPIFSVVSILIHPLTQLGIVILMVVLFLFNKEDLRSRLIRLAGTSDLNKTTEALDEAVERLMKMFTAQIFVNATTGLLVGIALALLGIPGAILWGVLTFILRFIPYIGSIMASVLPVIIAASIGEGWTLALITAGILVGIEIIVGQILEPLFIGKMTGLSPVAIVASAAFWTALWGPIGLILATPLTIGLLVVGRNIESLDFLEVMLGSEPVLTPVHALYQRLLAADVVEAAELAQSHVNEDQLDLFLSDVAVPSLLLANADRESGLLSAERQTLVVHTFSEMLDELIDDSSSESSASLVLIAPPGVMNLAATLACSAFLTVKKVPHRMLPQDVMSPGTVHQIDMASINFACFCYLVSPSQAKHNYALRRLTGLLPDTKVVSVAWSTGAAGIDLQSPASISSMLPAEPLSASA
jgi:predicted PurR-regulated permease PerM